MQKVWIILKSEFLRRIQTRMFILTTLLAPILLVAVGAVPGLIGYYAATGNEQTIAVVDETEVLLDLLSNQGSRFMFEAAAAGADSLERAVREGNLKGYLVLPDSLAEGRGEATYFSSEGSGFSFGMMLGSAVEDAVQNYRLTVAEASPEVLDILQDGVSVEMMQLTEEGGAKEDASFIYSIIGYIMGFIIYGALFAYGGIVMQSVIEEKTSRVIEVIVSSVRPFQLLMGKVLGIGLVGLMQFFFWGLLIGGVLTFASSIFALFMDPAQLGLHEGASPDAMLQAAGITIPTLEPTLFIGFVLFFLGGYLLYASLFAAVGSAVEQQNDAQSLMMPITLLIIMPILFITVLVEHPNSTLSVVLSLIPFFSPILMVVRIAATEVPFWQLALSYALLFGTFVGTIWASSRIYRVGILMYGKKPTLMEMARWFRYS